MNDQLNPKYSEIEAERTAKKTHSTVQANSFEDLDLCQFRSLSKRICIGGWTITPLWVICTKFSQIQVAKCVCCHQGCSLCFDRVFSFEKSNSKDRMSFASVVIFKPLSLESFCTSSGLLKVYYLATKNNDHLLLRDSFRQEDFELLGD